jgi:hypothetical protein
MISRKIVENYSDSISSVVSKSRSKLESALQQLDYSRDVSEIRDATIAIMNAACSASTAVSGEIACLAFDELRSMQVGEKLGAVVETSRDPVATEGAVRAFVQKLVDGQQPEKFIALCLDRLDYETRRAANMCVYNNAQRDPKRPKWARVPIGDGTCDFCMLLASRGFVYSHKELATHSHSNCRCVVVPGWEDSPAVEGYDPQQIYDSYLGKAVEATAGHTERVEADLSAKSKRKRLPPIATRRRFANVTEMKSYLSASRTVDELYERADEVFAEFKKYWDDGSNGSKSMLLALSNTAKAARKRLAG